MAKKSKDQAVEEKTDSAAQEGDNVQAQTAEFPEAPTEGPHTGHAGIDLLLDMDVTVTVAVGQAEIPIQRLLQLGPGSILKLNKPVNEPVDLYLKDSKFAAGTVVVVDDKFAVKIDRILAPHAVADDRSD